MIRTATLVSFLSLAACQGEGELNIVDPNAATDSGTPFGNTTTPTGGGTGSGTGGGGGCGDVNEWAMTLEGQVVDGSGQGLGSVEVRVEERVWHPTTTVMGSTLTDGQGFFLVTLPEVVDVENCWGTILDYTVVAEQGPRAAERGVNNPLYNAIQDGSLAADIAPLTL